MNIHPIHTDADYQAALKIISGYINDEPAPNSVEADHCEILLALIENYEAKHYPIDLPDPIEAIKFRMEQKRLTVADMQPFLGNANRVYEILNRKRKLS